MKSAIKTIAISALTLGTFATLGAPPASAASAPAPQTQAQQKDGDCKEGFSQGFPPTWTNCSDHDQEVIWATFNNADPAVARNGTSCMPPGKHELKGALLVGWPYSASKNSDSC